MPHIPYHKLVGLRQVYLEREFSEAKILACPSIIWSRRPAPLTLRASNHAKHPVSAHRHLCGLHGRRRAAPRAKRRRCHNGAFGSDGAVGGPADADDAAKSVE